MDINNRFCHHRVEMRTTLDIDADILEIAKERAKGQKVSVGKALSALARRGAEARIQLVKKDGVFVIPKGTAGGPFGPDEVQAALDSEYEGYEQYFRTPDPK
jgi:hypothetical protein